MSDTIERKKKLQPLLARLKKLQQEIAQATEQLASDQGLMSAYEQERDRNYDKCREMGIEPENLEAEIDSLLTTADKDLSRLESRFEILSNAEDQDDNE